MTPRVPSWACLIYISQLEWGVSDGGIGLSAHLGPLIFTSYIRTFLHSFRYTIIGFPFLIVNKPLKAVIDWIKEK